jgi:hypothetical protein
MSTALNPTALRRLARYHARLEGAQTLLQAVEATYRNLAENFETALRAACEDASIELPPPGTSASIQVDWSTGDVSWAGQPNNGRVEHAEGGS